jgi:MFS family permease
MRATGRTWRLLQPDHYGWVIVATLSVTETVTWGIVYYGFPVFLRPMEQDLGASRVAVTGAFSVGLGVSALAALPVGRWIDRHGARGLMTVGSCLTTCLTFAWARVETLPALYAVWFGMGVAMAATLYEPAFAVVVSWFPRGRDRALLTVTLAAGLASTIFMPIEAWLLSRVGWRSALTILTVVLGVVTIPMHAALLRRAPTGPSHRQAGSGQAAPARGMALDAARRTAVFWVLSAAFFVSNFATGT